MHLSGQQNTTFRLLDHLQAGPLPLGAPASFGGGGSYRWSFSASLSESRDLPAARLIRRGSSGRSRRRVRMASSPPGALRSFPDTAGVLAKTPGSGTTGDTARRQSARPRREGRRAPSEAQVPDTAVSVSTCFLMYDLHIEQGFQAEIETQRNSVLQVPLRLAVSSLSTVIVRFLVPGFPASPLSVCLFLSLSLSDSQFLHLYLYLFSSKSFAGGARDFYFASVHQLLLSSLCKPSNLIPALALFLLSPEESFSAFRTRAPSSRLAWTSALQGTRAWPTPGFVLSLNGSSLAVRPLALLTVSSVIVFLNVDCSLISLERTPKCSISRRTTSDGRPVS